MSNFLSTKDIFAAVLNFNFAIGSSGKSILDLRRTQIYIYLLLKACFVFIADLKKPVITPFNIHKSKLRQFIEYTNQNLISRFET